MPSPALIIRKTLIKLTIPFLLNTLISVVECLVQCSVPQAALNRKPTYFMWGKNVLLLCRAPGKISNQQPTTRQILITDTCLKYIYYLLNISIMEKELSK